MNFEEQLKISWAAARVNKGLTQDEVCVLMDITKPTIINWEKGITEPRLSQAHRLATIYGISLDNIRI